MKLKIINRRTQEFEKDLGEDDLGQPMISTLQFRHWIIRSDTDVRPHIETSHGSWYNCYMHPEKGSLLEKALRNLCDGNPLGLSGIRSVSSDGLQLEFCWR